MGKGASRTIHRYRRPQAERMALWSGRKIVNSDNSGQTTNVRKNPEYSLASQPIREQSHARATSMQEAPKAKKREQSLLRKRQTQQETHANVHGRGVEASEKRTATLITVKFLGLEHLDGRANDEAS